MTKKELIEMLKDYDDDLVIISNVPLSSKAGDLLAVLQTKLEKVQTPQAGDLITEYVIGLSDEAKLTPVLHLLFGHQCNHTMKVN